MKATLCLPTKADAWFPGVGKTQLCGTEGGSAASPPRLPQSRQPGGCEGWGSAGCSRWAGAGGSSPRGGILLPHPGVPGLSPHRRVDGAEGGGQGGLPVLRFVLQGTLPWTHCPSCLLSPGWQTLISSPRLPLSSLQGSSWFFSHH